MKPWKKTNPADIVVGSLDLGLLAFLISDFGYNNYTDLYQFKLIVLPLLLLALVGNLYKIFTYKRDPEINRSVKDFTPMGQTFSRFASAMEDTIFQAIGVNHIIHLEQEFAERLTKKINLKKNIENFEIETGKSLIGKTIEESDFLKSYKLNIITIIRKKYHTNLLGRYVEKREVVGLTKPSMIFQSGDILVVFGKDSDIKNYLQDHADGFIN